MFSHVVNHVFGYNVKNQRRRRSRRRFVQRQRQMQMFSPSHGRLGIVIEVNNPRSEKINSLYVINRRVKTTMKCFESFMRLTDSLNFII